jgi:probable rRNA maturation factor
MSDIVNLQRKISIDTAQLELFTTQISETVPEALGKTYSVAIINDSRMRQLNEMFRGKASTTDVLSFRHKADSFEPNKENLGDIVISAEQAARQAEENGLELDREIKQLVLHGLLHLCGFDHETDNGEMDAREIQLRNQLKI